jgi:hypothetical protein
MEKISLGSADRSQLNWITAYLTSFLIMVIGAWVYKSDIVFQISPHYLFYIGAAAAISFCIGMFFSIKGFVYSAIIPTLYIIFICVAEYFLGYILYANYKGGGVPGLIELMLLCVIIPLIIIVTTIFKAHFLFSKAVKRKDMLFYSIRLSSILMAVTILAYLILFWSPYLTVQEFFMDYEALFNKILVFALISGISSIVLYSCYLLKRAK